MFYSLCLSLLGVPSSPPPHELDILNLGLVSSEVDKGVVDVKKKKLINSAPVPSDVDCELPPATQMLLLESSVDQINKSLFPKTVLSSVMAQFPGCVHSVLEAIGP